MPELPRVLITGSTQGIGLAVAEALAPDHRLVVHGRDATRAAEVAAGFPDARALAADLRDVGSLAAAVEGLGDLDGLVHCAGVAGDRAAADLDPQLLDDVLAVNLRAPVELTRLLLPGLRRRRGTVVLVNSTATLRTIAGWSAYSASKAGLRAVADALRVEEAGSGVRVSSVYPGRTDTAMQHDMARQHGRTFDPTTAIAPAAVAGAVRYALTAPASARVTELVIEPR